MRIFIVIPLHNEEEHIEYVLKSVAKYKLSIVVVEDGSVDNSKLKIKKLGIKNLTLLEHGVNLGKGAAMKTGAEYAFKKGAAAIIFMDSDGQHIASDLGKFVDNLEGNKNDIVLGSRNFRTQAPFIRFVGNKVASTIMRLFFGIDVSDILCGFRGITKKAYKKVSWESSGYGVETEILARASKEKLKLVEVPIETIYHDPTKGVTILDAFGVFGEVVKWRLTI
ncbi:MAG TPA: glycosyltransferase family 2 protein [Patescibacteria group bacterium]|nr:glycosyltransferase family 2 protein [Patescibacteria group bacterium]